MSKIYSAVSVLVVLLFFGCDTKKGTVIETFSEDEPVKSFTSVQGEASHVKWKSTVVWSEGSDTVTVALTATLEEGWHLYSQVLESDEGPLPTEFSFEASDNYALVGKVEEGEAKNEYDENFAMNVRFFDKQADFLQVIVRKSSSAFKLKGNVNYMVCNDEMCLPPIDVPLEIAIEAK